jgi:hypothetical protein
MLSGTLWTCHTKTTNSTAVANQSSRRTVARWVLADAEGLPIRIAQNREREIRLRVDDGRAGCGQSLDLSLSVAGAEVRWIGYDSRAWTFRAGGSRSGVGRR